jgi:2'-5' RNA ligase
VVTLPPPRIAHTLRGLREKLGVSQHADEPHITLKMPFQVRTSLRDVQDRLLQVVLRTRPITVSLQGIGGFPGPYAATVYATIGPNPRLLALHNDLVATLHGAIENVLPYTEEVELESYVPHITIASDLSEDEFGRLMSSCQGRELRGRFTVEEVILMRRGASGQWRAVASYMLGARQPRSAPAR